MLQAGAVPRAAAADTTSLNSFGIGVAGRRQLSAVGVNGGRAFTNDIQLDGLPVMGGGYNEASVVPNTEGLQEVRVISNNFSAEYGRGQAVISMSTKSGTNAFHGQRRLHAAPPRSSTRTPSRTTRRALPSGTFRVNDVGGSIGGPILRNKLFFFSSYHLLRNDQADDLAADGADGARARRQLQPDASSATRTATPCRRASSTRSTSRRSTRISTAAPRSRTRIIPNPNPSAVQMYSFYPLPNRTPDDVYNTNNFEATTTQTVRRHSSNNRVDFQRRHALDLRQRRHLLRRRSSTPRPFGTAPFNDAAGDRAATRTRTSRSATRSCSARRLLLDVRYGVSRINTKNLNGNKDGFTDYDRFGVPDNLHAVMHVPRARAGRQSRTASAAATAAAATGPR